MGAQAAGRWKSQTEALRSPAFLLPKMSEDVGILCGLNRFLEHLNDNPALESRREASNGGRVKTGQKLQGQPLCELELDESK